MVISIHALREEGDTAEDVHRVPEPDISIHALREEGDRSRHRPVPTPSRFQSTPSARRATRTSLHRRACPRYFNPRPPRGGRPNAAVSEPEADVFQSTPSARRATIIGAVSVEVVSISIHALREEGDSAPTSISDPERRFQSTPSARRATTRVMGAKPF